MQLVWHKVICSILIFISAFFGYLCPMLINSSKYKTSKLGFDPIDILCAFGGGAFIALSIVHLIPDAYTSSENKILIFSFYGSKVNSVWYIILSGFSLSLVCESIVHALFPHKTEIICNKDESKITSTNVSENSYIEDYHSFKVNINKTQNITYSQNQIIDDNSSVVCNKQNSSLFSFITGLVLVSALVIHSIFEGMVVGISKSVPKIWLTTGVIVAHKWIEILIVYVTLSTRGIKPLYFVAILALGSPIGVIIGALISLSNTLAEAVCSALAAGTILYVSCVEVIPDVFHSKTGSTLIKLVAFICGTIIVSALTLLDNIAESPV
ncbi:zinc transporter, putative [Cryptosporidium muris RN66]|uniref:Zinc transporter, putative n=1 Tax=Cryptosporidium muris (strain RN66) TaxID=441375 RepID=B6A9K6_CRYMR|nr:zinc transporter, putative [Cryptosporidium muris RN66]EEA04897.1 zinc transporter, putative [Cryptosporidium muris RN66]|eukprot:XP_002139246.1 zinc transporter [Cryptosporidium muris RN66]